RNGNHLAESVGERASPRVCPERALAFTDFARPMNATDAFGFVIFFDVVKFGQIPNAFAHILWCMMGAGFGKGEDNVIALSFTQEEVLAEEQILCGNHPLSIAFPN